MSRWHLLLAGVWALALLAGCSRRVPAPAHPAAKKPPAPKNKPRIHVVRKSSASAHKAKPERPANPLVTSTREAGILSGRVRWQGAVDPLVEAFARRSAAQTVAVDGKDVPVKLTPRLRINLNNQGVANVVVWLENAPGAGTTEAADELELRQRDGDFHPHVLTTRTGTRLKLVSADDRADFQATGAQSFSVVLPRGKPALRTLSRPGLVEIRSEAQPWSSAYLWVFDHKYSAQTDPDGRFHLPAVPPGKYRLVLWHEGWRGSSSRGDALAPAVRKQVAVTLGEHEGKRVEWTLSRETGEK